MIESKNEEMIRSILLKNKEVVLRCFVYFWQITISNLTSIQATSFPGEYTYILPVDQLSIN